MKRICIERRRMHCDAQQRHGDEKLSPDQKRKGTDTLAKKRHCTVGKVERSNGIALQPIDGKVVKRKRKE